MFVVVSIAPELAPDCADRIGKMCELLLRRYKISSCDDRAVCVWTV